MIKTISKYNKIDKKQKGISIIEVVIASAIISLSMIAISHVYGNLLQLSLENTEKVQAVFLLDEGVEALKIIRNYSWNSIASTTPNIDYYLEWKDNRWHATTTSNTIDDNFVRKFSVENVYRDPSTLNIVYEGGVINDDSKLVNMNVSWNYKGATSTKQISFYLFNIYE